MTFIMEKCYAEFSAEEVSQKISGIRGRDKAHDLRKFTKWWLTDAGQLWRGETKEVLDVLGISDGPSGRLNRYVRDLRTITPLYLDVLVEGRLPLRTLIGRS